MNDQPFHLCFQQVGDANLWFISIGYQLLGCVWKPRDDLQNKFFLGLSCVSVTVTNGSFIDGRTTGIEPARGGFTIHCLDPLGYIRPYPRTGFLSLYLRSDPFWTPLWPLSKRSFILYYTVLLLYYCIVGIFEEAQVWNPIQGAFPNLYIQGAGLDLAWWCPSRWLLTQHWFHTWVGGPSIHPRP